MSLDMKIYFCFILFELPFSFCSIGRIASLLASPSSPTSTTKNGPSASAHSQGKLALLLQKQTKTTSLMLALSSWVVAAAVPRWIERHESKLTAFFHKI